MEWRFGRDCDPRAINDLCRHQLVEKILKDVLADIKICRLEGWDPLELPCIIRAEMDRI
jgi:hypothetical protein